MTRMIATPADAIQLLIDDMERDCRERHRGAYEPTPAYQPPPEDAMPRWEMTIRNAMLKVSEAEDHETRALALEQVADLCTEQADREWRLLRGEVRE